MFLNFSKKNELWGIFKEGEIESFFTKKHLANAWWSIWICVDKIVISESDEQLPNAFFSISDFGEEIVSLFNDVQL